MRVRVPRRAPFLMGKIEKTAPFQPHFGSLFILVIFYKSPFEFSCATPENEKGFDLWSAHASVHTDGFAANHDHALGLRDSLDLACLDPVLATVLADVRHEILHGHDRF